MVTIFMKDPNYYIIVTKKHPIMISAIYVIYLYYI